ncbi:hypothetical protein MNQ98_15520 [Paenibacillus sp. N3/727]|uniref:hypothetical protein n=1 Tax=Paenibacillus sp. N3/727 TaxID=2925845 RepID=UPI001F534B6E|nr:hypothetical protein [Paenibacillus sp. N3/727]UNK15961.1 hypothetical protein MNQ98_15520 [Paenibacillus sp. N3/727]
MKTFYGKIPVKGLPRFSRLNLTAEDRRFNITDPSGNTLIVGEPLGDSTTVMDRYTEDTKNASKFEKAYKWAFRYAYSKEDFLGASNLLESAFSKQSDPLSNELYFKAKVLQIDVLVALGRTENAIEIAQELESFVLSSNEETILQNEIQRFSELKEELFL